MHGATLKINDITSKYANIATFYITFYILFIKSSHHSKLRSLKY